MRAFGLDTKLAIFPTKHAMLRKIRSGREVNSRFQHAPRTQRTGTLPPHARELARDQFRAEGRLVHTATVKQIWRAEPTLGRRPHALCLRRLALPFRPVDCAGDGPIDGDEGSQDRAIKNHVSVTEEYGVGLQFECSPQNLVLFEATR